MAEYQDDKHVKFKADTEFDEMYSPGERAPVSGIYRCRWCGREAVVGEERILPPQNDHQHRDDRFPVKWRLLVRTSYIPETFF
jgi:hypothetical protein